MIYRSSSYAGRIEELTGRAKTRNPKLNDLDIGESCYVLGLSAAVYLYRVKEFSRDRLSQKQRELQDRLENYYQLAECFENAVSIRNKYGSILTQANKDGCEICKQLVKIFDGREDT